MKIGGLLLGILMIAPLAKPANAENATYAEGFEDGKKAGYDAGFNDGRRFAGGGIGGGKNSISDVVWGFQRPTPLVGGGSQMQQPDFFLIPTQKLPDGGALTSGAIPLFGKLDASNMNALQALAEQIREQNAMSGNGFSLYAVPINPLVEDRSSISGWVYNPGEHSTPKVEQFGSSKTLLEKFGNIKVPADAGVTVLDIQ